jgi:hypothetical protein
MTRAPSAVIAYGISHPSLSCGTVP